jgi:predicted 3-demethylubiquinone-9 3-methyltransferase (glyoxalase superfamily)
MNEITPCLWFDTEGEEAANLYTSVFPNSRIVDVARYGEAGPRHGSDAEDEEDRDRRS